MKNELNLFGAGVLMLCLIGLYSCTKEDENVDNVAPQPAAVAEIDYGQAHNEIIDSYYSHSERTALTLAEKIALVDDYFVQEGITPLFSDMVAQNRNMELFLIDMHENDHPLAYYANMFDSLHVAGLSTERELEYQLDIIETMVENSTVIDQMAVIDDLRDIAMVDALLDEASREEILIAFDITRDSMEYWTSQGRGLPWYAKDAAGGWTAITTGFAGWATALGGPVAGGAAILGVAAVSSMIPN